MLIKAHPEHSMPKSDSRRAALKLVQPPGECDNSQSDTDIEAMTAQQQRKIVMFADVSDSNPEFINHLDHPCSLLYSSITLY